MVRRSLRLYGQQFPKRRLKLPNLDCYVDPYSTAESFNSMIGDLVNKINKRDEETTYFHPRLISFAEATKRDYWAHQGMEGTSARDPYEALWYNKPRDVKTCVGVFVTAQASPAGNRIKWESSTWHAWGAALVNNEEGTGKHLYIWDCDGYRQISPETRPRDVLLGAQRSLLELAERRFDIQSFWFCGESEYRGECVKSTANWCASIANAADSGYSPNDHRFTDFTRIDRL